MDWVTALVLWTPVSVAILVLFIVVLLVVAILVWGNRAGLVGWFTARLAEGSTKHAYTVALSTTAAWLLDLAGMLPAGEHVPFALVRVGWLIALALFIKPDAQTNPSGAGPAA